MSIQLSCIDVHRDVIRGIARRARESRDGKETGGLVLGDDSAPRLELRSVLGSGPNAVRKADYFQRDLEFSRAGATEAFNRDGSQWVGEWHSHLNGQVEPSAADITTYVRHLRDPELALARFSALIVTADDPAWEAVSVWFWLCTESRLVLKGALRKLRTIGGADGGPTA